MVTDPSGLIRETAERVIETLRRLTPTALVPLLISVRTLIAWSIPGVRENARTQMRFLLEESTPGADIDVAARKYVHWMVTRAERRWHPEMVTNQRVEGLEHLLAARDLGRGVILNFMHHGQYDGTCASLARLGVPTHAIVYPWGLRDDAPRWMKQHLRVAGANGGTLVSADVGTKGIVALLDQGAVVSLASDVPGRTPVTFAGRELLGSFGAAAVAAKTQAPVVPMTFEVDDDGPHIQLYPALHAEDFPTPQAMFDVMLSTQEKAVLATPEAVDLPTTKWGMPESAQSSTSEKRAPG